MLIYWSFGSMLTKDRKNNIVKDFSKSEKDVGSIEVQIGLLSERIEQIAEHLKLFPKDKHSRLGLVKLVGKRRKFSRYLEKNDKASYETVMAKIKRK